MMKSELSDYTWCTGSRNLVPEFGSDPLYESELSRLAPESHLT